MKNKWYDYLLVIPEAIWLIIQNKGSVKKAKIESDIVLKKLTEEILKEAVITTELLKKQREKNVRRN